MSWALSQPLKGTQKLLLIGLANHATSELEHARPSVETMAVYANVDPRNVQRGLRQLEANGWIEKTGEYAVAQRRDRVVNVYRLICERGGASDTPRPERGGASVPNGVAPAPPEPSLEPSNGSLRSPKVEKEPLAFDEWMADYEQVTSRQAPRRGTTARAHLASTFAALVAEGYSPDELKLATRGAWANEWRRENGYVKPENVLKKTKVAGLVEDGRHPAVVTSRSRPVSAAVLKQQQMEHARERARAATARIIAKRNEET